MKKTMGGIIIIFAMILAIALVTGCASESGRSGLSGTWEQIEFPGSSNQHILRNIVATPDVGDTFYPGIEFSSNRFTITSAINSVTQRNFLGVPTRSYRDTFFGTSFTDRDIDTNIYYQNMEFVGPFNDRSVYRGTLSGTYSLSDAGDRIELIFSNDEIRVFDFERTENTIDIWIDGSLRRFRRN